MGCLKYFWGAKRAEQKVYFWVFKKKHWFEGMEGLILDVNLDFFDVGGNVDLVLA